MVRIMDYSRKQHEHRRKVKESKKSSIVSRRLSTQKEVQLRLRDSPSHTFAVHWQSYPTSSF